MSEESKGQNLKEMLQSIEETQKKEYYAIPLDLVKKLVSLTNQASSLLSSIEEMKQDIKEIKTELVALQTSIDELSEKISKLSSLYSNSQQKKNYYSKKWKSSGQQYQGEKRFNKQTYKRQYNKKYEYDQSLYIPPERDSYYEDYGVHSEDEPKEIKF